MPDIISKHRLVIVQEGVVVTIYLWQSNCESTINADHYQFVCPLLLTVLGQDIGMTCPPCE